MFLLYPLTFVYSLAISTSMCIFDAVSLVSISTVLSLSLIFVVVVNMVKIGISQVHFPTSNVSLMISIQLHVTSHVMDTPTLDALLVMVAVMVVSLLPLASINNLNSLVLLLPQSVFWTCLDSTSSRSVMPGVVNMVMLKRIRQTLRTCTSILPCTMLVMNIQHLC